MAINTDFSPSAVCGDAHTYSYVYRYVNTYTPLEWTHWFAVECLEVSKKDFNGSKEIKPQGDASSYEITHIGREKEEGRHYNNIKVSE